MDKGGGRTNNSIMPLADEVYADGGELSPAAKVLLLRNVPLLEGLEAEQLLAIGELCESVSFEDGALVFSAGDLGDRLYIIARGEARVNLENGNVLATLGPQECFGEMALLDGGQRSASVSAVGPLRCLAIGRDDFGDLLEVSPSLAKSVMRVLIRRLRIAGS